MHLNDPTLFGEKVPVAGRWLDCDGRETTTIRNPATGRSSDGFPNLVPRKQRKLLQQP